MTLPRARVTLASVSVALTAALFCGAHADAHGTVTALCQSGGETQECDSHWYTGPVSVVWQAIPAPLGTSPCLLGVTYKYDADTVSGLSCTAMWPGPESNTYGFTLHVEVTSPTAEAAPGRSPDFNGWYNHPVAVNFNGQGYSGPSACIASGVSPTVIYAGPDAVSASASAACTDPAGKSVYPSFGLRYDATPPTITGAVPSRPPDFNGWYNHPVTFAFTGTDATAGIEECSSPTYAGPDSASAQVVGTCRDRAGNVATLAVKLRYLATPPRLSVEPDPQDGILLLHWQSSAGVKIVRSPGLRGASASTVYHGASGSFEDTHVRNGVRYRYTVTAEDQAGNVTVRRFLVMVGPRLLSPVADARLSMPPLLRWTPVRRASYYNVQLFRRGKVFSAWPTHSSLRLKSIWRFDGRLYRLEPGRYRWYAWPGFGPLGAARYGRLIGSGTFVVVPRARPGQQGGR